MTTIIVSGHGNFATGIESMLKLVIGECENTYFVDFTEDLSSQDLRNKFNQICNGIEGDIVFLCDIAGGTPFNQASLLMHERNKSQSVIGGINIPLVLSVMDQRDELNYIELLQNARQEATENIKIFGEYSSESQNESMDDGI